MTASRNLGEIVGPSVDRSKVALICPRADGSWRSVTFGEMQGGIAAAAGALLDRGWAPGQTIGILGENSPEYLASHFGGLRAGLVVVPLNSKFPAETMNFVIADTAARAVFVAADGVGGLPAGVEAIVMPTLGSGSNPPADRTAAHGVSTDDLALILYTSGSTGRPKGVMLSHGAQWAIIETLGRQMLQAGAGGQTLIVAAPLFHMNALAFLSVALHIGATVVLLPRFDPASFLAAIEAHKVEIVTGVPTMLAMIAQDAESRRRYDTSSVQWIFVGSAPLTGPVVAVALEVFPNATITNGYGTTEIGSGMFGPHPDGLPRPQLSIGYPAAQVKLRWAAGGAGEEGVLEMSCASNMLGYLNLPEETARKMKHGWVDTGDVMRRDRDGFYYVVGRADDMFICGGENVFPGEVENVLDRHPGVGQSCVIPVPDDIKGHKPVAFVVARPGEAPTEQELKDFVLSRAQAHAHPRRVYFLDQMPLGGTNKIDRAKLAEIAARNTRP